MDVSLLVQGDMTATSIYALHLLVRIMRAPHRVGAWFPRLIARWHTGLAEGDEAKRQRAALTQGAMNAITAGGDDPDSPPEQPRPSSSSTR